MSSCYCSFEWLSGCYGSKVTPVDILDTEKTLEPVFLYVFRRAFTASLSYIFFVTPPLGKLNCLQSVIFNRITFSIWRKIGFMLIFFFVMKQFSHRFLVESNSSCLCFKQIVSTVCSNIPRMKKKNQENILEQISENTIKTYFTHKFTENTNFVFIWCALALFELS